MISYQLFGDLWINQTKKLDFFYFNIGISYEKYVSIGRIVSSPSVRGKGVGKKLIVESLKNIKELFREQPIKISAQCYLIKFYQSFGFETTGEEYLEDNIPHIAMVYSEN